MKILPVEKNLPQLIFLESLKINRLKLFALLFSDQLDLKTGSGRIIQNLKQFWDSIYKNYLYVLNGFPSSNIQVHREFDPLARNL